MSLEMGAVETGLAGGELELPSFLMIELEMSVELGLRLMKIRTSRMRSRCLPQLLG